MRKKKRSLNSNPSSSSQPDLDTENLPIHIAVIMDGNGRWAKKRRLNRVSGHSNGADAVREIVRTCRRIGVSYLTLYAFSTENWQRPRSEVAALMALLRRFLNSEKDEMKKEIKDLEKRIKNTEKDAEKIEPKIVLSSKRLEELKEKNVVTQESIDNKKEDIKFS